MRRTILGSVMAIVVTAGTSFAGVDVGVSVRAGIPAPPVPVIVAPAPPAPTVVVQKGNNGKHLGHYKVKGKNKKHM